MNIMIILIVQFNQCHGFQLSVGGKLGMCGWIISKRSQVRDPIVEYFVDFFRFISADLVDEVQIFVRLI